MIPVTLFSEWIRCSTVTLARYLSKASEKKSKLSEVDSAISKRDYEFLRARGLEGKLFSEEFLNKFSKWEESKLKAAKQCDYPFSDGELELLEKALGFNERYGGSHRKTIYQIYTESNKNYDSMKKEAEVSCDISSYFKVSVEPTEVFSVTIPDRNASYDLHGFGRRGTTIPVKIPLCTVCNKIMAHIAYDNAIRDDIYIRG